MRVLFLGDIVGRLARQRVVEQMADWRRDWRLDFVIVNGENAAGGFGITAAIADELFAVGVDVITTGNHAWDQKEILSHIDQEPRLLRPANYPDSAPGRGYGIYDAPRGKKVLVMNLMGRVFMNPLDDPFAVADKILKRHVLSSQLAFSFIDFHGEAPAKKWRWVNLPTAGQAVWWEPTAISPPPMRRSCPKAPPIKPMRACAAIMIR
ncbi:hypothetical protein JCM17845_24790 [Iodidimonas gelatinilytica]|uniref:Metallophosphoesterase n=1 Tax=Iodidimonas gelatinilytica TaxID=1236966 RepID=A0A5A7N466_9PROT|nr:hypothetical protein JCM17845_24790 [Iodidimonas gelatinilytica]